MEPNTTPDDAALADATSSTIAAWGDSLTAGAGGTPYPTYLTQLCGLPVFNGGIGGETSVQIQDRMLAATDKHAWPTIIWAGRNDSDKPEQVKASIATMVNALPHTNYAVLSVLNGSGEGQGTYGYNVVAALNTDLKALYGAHFLDVRAYLVSLGNPSLAQDAADHQADIPPTSLRSDFLHLSSSGYALVANFLQSNCNIFLAKSNSPMGANSNVITDASLLGKVTQIANNSTDALTEWRAANGNTVTMGKDGNGLTASGTLYLNSGSNTVLQAANTTAVEISANALYVKHTVVQEAGDLEFGNAANGVILKAPNGGRYRITVSDSGDLSAVAL
jgi:lysophospholipase L1-like esterase